MQRIDSAPPPTLRIDAHQHFWRYSPQEFGWIDDAMACIRRDFLPGDLAPELRANSIGGTLAVQARQSVAETEWLLELAAQSDWIVGVVGWLPLASPDFETHLERHRANAKLRGLRHVLQAEPEVFFDDADFDRGLRRMQSTGLVYDLLIVEQQMPAALRLVDRHPNQVIVLDHLAKPRIADGTLHPWAKRLHALASREHVCCKLSGMVTEADFHRWTIDDLRPFVETALEAFGPSRLLFGSDWPVCTVASSYTRWLESAEELLRGCSFAEREAIFGGNAARVYGLTLR